MTPFRAYFPTEETANETQCNMLRCALGNEMGVQHHCDL